MSSPDIERTFYAYGPSTAAIETVMRLGAVKRWHMIDTTRVQTLAEHSGNVGVLVYGIAATAPGAFFGDPASAAGMSLLHDLPEVFTGDFPGHAKRFVDGIAELEQSVLPSCYQYRPAGYNIAKLIKACDLADGIRHIRLHGVDITARQAREQIEEKLANLWSELHERWPADIWSHAKHWVMFYAYEMS